MQRYIRVAEAVCPEAEGERAPRTSASNSNTPAAGVACSGVRRLRLRSLETEIQRGQEGGGLELRSAVLF